MMKPASIAILITALSGCSSQSALVPTDDKYTNNWKTFENLNGKKGWVGALRNDDKINLSFESYRGENVLTVLTINASECKNELFVDTVKYSATSTTKQENSHSECYIKVFNEDAFEIAASMAMSDTIDFNGTKVNVSGFDAVMNNFLLKNGASYNKVVFEFQDLAETKPSLSFSRSGKWRVTMSDGSSSAVLKAISSNNAAILLNNELNADKSATLSLSFIEGLEGDNTSCRSGVDINNEGFDARTNLSREGGKSACVYSIYGSDAKYAIKLLENKRTSYVEGIVFDTEGLSNISSKFLY